MPGNSQPVAPFGSSSYPALFVTGAAVAGAVAFLFVKYTQEEKKALTDNTTKEWVSHNTRLFVFGLPSSRHVLGLPIGQHIYLSCNMKNPRTGEGEEKYISRQYTPISSDTNKDDRGTFKLIVKIYPHSQHSNFPNGGWMTQYLESLQIGDTIDVRGPAGKLQYMGDCEFSIRKQKFATRRVGMIAGGTGVTPMFQLLLHVLTHEPEGLEVSLLFANQTPSDILLREELEKLQKQHPAQSDWSGYVGFVSKEMLQATMPPPEENPLILMCGPPPMIEKCCQPALAELGYDADRTFAY